MSVQDDDSSPRSAVRRQLLGGAIGLGTMPVIRVAQAKAPKSMRPQPGDQLIYLMGERKGELVKPADLTLGGPQELAYAMDPATKVVRDGSRLNQIVVLRLDPGELTEETRAAAADGVLAYSSVCTHQGCDVSQWVPEKGVMLCVCHGSEFDPKDLAAVVAGPAPKRLASLPLKIDGDMLVVADNFNGRVGFKR